VHVVPWVSVIGPPLLKSSKMPFPEHCAVTGKTLAENLAGCPPLAEGQVGFRPLYLPFFLMIFPRISFLPRQRSTRIAASPVMGCGDVCRESFLLWRTPSRRLGTYRFYGVIWLQRVRLLNLAPEGSVAKITGKEGLYFSGMDGSKFLHPLFLSSKISGWHSKVLIYTSCCSHSGLCTA